MNKNTYSTEFKAQVVLEALREEKTANQIASEREIDPSLVSKWRAQAVADLHQLFAARTEADKLKIQHEREIDDLHRFIGARLIEIEWLKKKLKLT